MDIFEPWGLMSKERPILPVQKSPADSLPLVGILSHTTPKDWNDSFGKPINQEDLIGTILH